MSGWKYFWQIVEPVSRERHAPRSAGFGGPPEGEAPLLAGRPYRDRRKQAASRRTSVKGETLMINLVAREQWNARTHKGHVSLKARPDGIKYHYVGGRVDPDLVKDHGLCVALVKSIQRHHMDTNLWADIGYSAQACPHRQVFVGRGPGILPAANGDGLNAGHYAVSRWSATPAWSSPLTTCCTGCWTLATG